MAFSYRTVRYLRVFNSLSLSVKSVGEGAGVHFQPRNTMVRKGGYKASGAPARQEQTRLSAQRNPHSKLPQRSAPTFSGLH